MGDSSDRTAQSPSIGNTSTIWKPNFMTPENDVPLQDVIVTVDMSNEQENISDCFGSKLDEYTIHVNQNGEKEGTSKDECMSEGDNLDDHSAVAKRSTKRPAQRHHTRSEVDMSKALGAAVPGKFSGYTAAMKFNEPKPTLQTRLRKDTGDLDQRLRPFAGPELATGSGGRAANSRKRSVGTKLPIFAKGVKATKSDGDSGALSNPVSNKVRVMDRSKARQFRWKEEDMSSALDSVESKIMPPKMAAAHHGIPFRALRNRLRAKINEDDGVTGKCGKKARAKWTKWSERDLDQAIKAIREQGLSIRKAASFYGIPKSSLCDRLHGRRRCSHPGEEQVNVSLEGLDVTDHQVMRDVAANEEMTSARNVLRCRIKHGKVSRRDATANKSRNESLKHQLGDEVQVHILEESTLVDGTYGHSSPIKDIRRFGNCRLANGEPVEDETDLSECNFGHEKTMAYTNEEIAAEQDNIAIHVNRVPVLGNRTSHLRGRITMTDEIIDRKEILNKSAKSWTRREMENAIKDVTVNGFSIRQAANKHRIPKSSLADRISKDKCMKVVGKLVEELKPLAKTNEDMQRLQKLEDGKLNPKTVAKRFGMTYTCLRKLVAGEEAAMCFTGLQHGSEMGGLQEEIDRTTGDHVQLSFNKLSQNLQSSDTGGNAPARADSKGRRARLRWKRDNLEQAIAAVREGRLSLRGSSKMYGIPKSTLGDILRGKSSVGSTSKGNQLLNESEEASIAGWLITMAKAGRCVKVKEVLETVKAILDNRSGTVPRLKDNLPKDSWWYGFLARHKEVAEIRRQSKFGTGRGTEDIEVRIKKDSEGSRIEFAPDKVTVLSADEQYFVVNDTPEFLQSKVALEPV